jgi:hypothetical protein
MNKILKKHPDAQAALTTINNTYSIWINFVEGVSNTRISEFYRSEEEAWKNANP